MNGEILSFMQWGFGICAGGFFSLVGLLWGVFRLIKISERDAQAELKLITNSVDAIKDALVGTMDEKGFITKHYELEKRIDSLEKLFIPKEMKNE